MNMKNNKLRHISINKDKQNRKYLHIFLCFLRWMRKSTQTTFITFSLHIFRAYKNVCFFTLKQRTWALVTIISIPSKKNKCFKVMFFLIMYGNYSNMKIFMYNAALITHFKLLVSCLTEINWRKLNLQTCVLKVLQHKQEEIKHDYELPILK